MKIKSSPFIMLSILLTLHVLTACSSLRDTATIGATTAGGAFVGSQVTDNTAGPVIGAVGGLLVGTGINELSKVNDKEKAASFYMQGQSDAVKSLYWAKRNWENNADNGGYDTVLYSVPIPERIENGTRLEPSARTFEAYAPRQ